MARLRDAQIVVLNRERTRFDAAVIAALPALELIVQTGGISPNVDVAAASAYGVTVTAEPGLPTSIDGAAEPGAPDLRQRPQRVRAAGPSRRPSCSPAAGWASSAWAGSAGAWLGWGWRSRCTSLPQGRRSRPSASPRAGRSSSPRTNCWRADSVFVCTRLLELTSGLVTRRHLRPMKRSAYLINVARGPIVDEAALVEALQQRRIADAGLDVYDREPLPADHPLISLDNVALTPHIGWVTAANGERFVDSVVERITRYLDGDVSTIANPAALGVRRSAG